MSIDSFNIVGMMRLDLNVVSRAGNQISIDAIV